MAAWSHWSRDACSSSTGRTLESQTASRASSSNRTGTARFSSSTTAACRLRRSQATAQAGTRTLDSLESHLNGGEADWSPRFQELGPAYESKAEALATTG